MLPCTCGGQYYAILRTAYRKPRRRRRTEERSRKAQSFLSVCGNNAITNRVRVFILGILRFLEPIIYPFISPFINKFWTKKAVKETSGTSDQNVSENSHLTCKTESNGDATANGTTIAADKKTD
ncbi:hypothetical protein JOB18_046032 [Solea senegalensis]|uniref:Uncharacterized protein n=1 Tax=Solea senegalensis TaxID=28829 RepID=A0AAV6R2V4_SOLSE|nr:hypothetical protein JOB18_046032 [Solea senegalensis]